MEEEGVPPPPLLSPSLRRAAEAGRGCTAAPSLSLSLFLWPRPPTTTLFSFSARHLLGITENALFRRIVLACRQLAYSTPEQRIESCYLRHRISLVHFGGVTAFLTSLSLFLSPFPEMTATPFAVIAAINSPGRFTDLSLSASSQASSGDLGTD